MPSSRDDPKWYGIVPGNTRTGSALNPFILRLCERSLKAECVNTSWSRGKARISYSR